MFMMKVSPMPEIGRFESAPRSMLDPSKSVWRCGFDRIPKMGCRCFYPARHFNRMAFVRQYSFLPVPYASIRCSDNTSAVDPLKMFPFGGTVRTLVNTLQVPDGGTCLAIGATP
jgi:hypothetical protein